MSYSKPRPTNVRHFRPAPARIMSARELAVFRHFGELKSVWDKPTVVERTDGCFEYRTGDNPAAIEWRFLPSTNLRQPFEYLGCQPAGPTGHRFIIRMKPEFWETQRESKHQG